MSRFRNTNVVWRPHISCFHPISPPFEEAKTRQITTLSYFRVSPGKKHDMALISVHTKTILRCKILYKRSVLHFNLFMTFLVNHFMGNPVYSFTNN